MCTLIENVGSVVTGSPYYQQSDPDEKIKKYFSKTRALRKCYRTYHMQLTQVWCS